MTSSHFGLSLRSTSTRAQSTPSAHPYRAYSDATQFDLFLCGEYHSFLIDAV